MMNGYSLMDTSSNAYSSLMSRFWSASV